MNKAISDHLAVDQAEARHRTTRGAGLLWSFLLMSASPGLAAPGDIFVGNDPQQAIVISNVPDDEGFVVLVRAPVDESARRPAAARQDEGRQRDRGAVAKRAASVEAMVNAAALETRIDPNLILAVMAVESAYDPAARSPKGAQGLMQLLPATAVRYGVADAYDPWQSILGGARYLADLLRVFDQDVSLAVAAYNAGERAVERHGRRIPPYRETMAYVPRVLARYRSLGARSL